MGYKEKLKDYTEGKLESREKESVESDIDRQRAIGDYLDERMDIGIFEENKDDSQGKPAGEDGELSKLVQKAVSRKLKKYSMIAGAVVLAIALFLMFGLSPLLDALYYDPGKTLSEENNMCSIIDPAMEVFAELRCTGKSFTGSESRAEGFGRYSVTLYFLSQLYGSERYDVTMDKGVFNRRYVEWLESYPLVYFTRYSGHMDEKIDDSADVAELKKLPETAVVTACFNFKEDISLSEIKDLDPGRKRIEYVVIRVSEEDSKMRGGYFGYSTIQPMFPWFGEAYDKEKYPDLNIAEQWPYIPEKTWESHFKSMLKYLADQKDLNKALGSEPEVYTDALQYVEKNGVKAYGALVTAPVNELLALRQDSRVESMFVIDAKLSRFGDLQLYR